MKLLKLVPDNTNIDFVRLRGWAFGLTLLLSVLAVGVTVARGLNMGVDFVGGLMIEERFATSPDLNKVRTAVDRLGLGGSFEGVHDIHAMDLVPKPAPSAYAGLCAAFDIDPTRALFVEDMARNLAPAKAIGMTTVWVDNGSEQHHDADRSYVDLRVTDVTAWVQSLLEDQ